MIEATPEVADLLARLASPFERKEVKFRPGATSGTRALAIAYVDARVIMDRLDEVLGPVNWQDEYEFLPDGSVLCKLRLRIGGEWITKMDVGGQSEQPDEGDRRKAAVSDALKRAAVKWRCGRYLYRLPQQWVDYDPQKKQLKTLPQLPGPGDAPAAKPAPKPYPAKKPPLPQTGAELLQRLRSAEDQFVAAGRCKAGDLIRYVREQGEQACFVPEIEQWAGPALALARQSFEAFKASHPAPNASVPVG